MMRVLHVLNSVRGGATMSLLSMLRASRRAGSDIDHYVTYPGRLGERSPALEGLATDWCAIPLATWNKARMPWTLRGQASAWKMQARTRFGAATDRALATLVDRWNIDIIHTNTVVIAAAARFSARTGIPHLWHIRERIGQDGFLWFSADDQEVARTIAEHSAALPVISEYVREFFTTHGWEPKTRLVYDGVDVEAFADPGASERAAAQRTQWRIPDGAPVIGMVGGLATSVKRHDVFLRAADKILSAEPASHFVIVGAIPSGGGALSRPTDDYVRRIKGLIDHLGLAGRVVFAGFDEDMPAVWRAMDIYVHPCEVEGFSRAILEAMAAGVPVVASEAGGNPEAIEDHRTGLLFRAGDFASCADAVMSLWGHDALNKAIVAAASAEVRSRFNPENHLKTMFGLFREIGSRRQGFGACNPVCG